MRGSYRGVLDDKSDPSRYSKWGRGDFDPEENTDNLIAALPEWHAHGLRAFTVGFQGGGPCATVPNRSAMEVNPFGADGKRLEEAAANRMERLIRAADKIGMAVIVSYFYPAQIRRLKDDDAVRSAVVTASRWLHAVGGSNVIIEPANEHNLQPYSARPVVHTANGMASLLRLAREESAGLPVGCSGGGSYINRTVSEASDVILIHGNGCTRQRIHQMIREIRSWGLNKPIVFNEDSQAIGNMKVAFNERFHGVTTTTTRSRSRRPTGRSRAAKISFLRGAWRKASALSFRRWLKRTSTISRGWKRGLNMTDSGGFASPAFIRRRSIMWSFSATASCTTAPMWNRF